MTLDKAYLLALSYFKGKKEIIKAFIYNNLYVFVVGSDKENYSGTFLAVSNSGKVFPYAPTFNETIINKLRNPLIDYRRNT